MSETSSNASSLADLPYAQRQFAEFYMAKTVVTVQDFTVIGFVVNAVVNRLKSEESHKPGIETIRVPIQQAGFLSLPPGHPQTDVLYVAHPSDPATYLPVADFHRLTFEHKFAEAIRLLMHLGARTISVTHTAVGIMSLQANCLLVSLRWASEPAQRQASNPSRPRGFCTRPN